MAIMRQLSDEGTSIVFITHKLREVRAVADRITVIRLGKVVGEASPDGVERRARVAHGRPRRRADRPQGPAAARRARPRGEGPPRHRRRAASRRRRRQLRRARRARSLAVAGVQGNGQTELTEAIVGLAAPRQRLRSRSTAWSSSARACARILDEGVGFVPEDRTEDGLVGTFTVAENLILDRSSDRPSSRGGTIRSGACSTSSRSAHSREFDIRTPGHRRPRRHAVGRQPAEGRHRARDEPRPEAARRGAADARRRRRLDRVHPQAHRRDAGCRHPGHRRLHRARRGRGARRPHHRDVPRPDRRHRARRHPARRARPHDGGREARGRGASPRERRTLGPAERRSTAARTPRAAAARPAPSSASRCRHRAERLHQGSLRGNAVIDDPRDRRRA